MHKLSKRVAAMVLLSMVGGAAVYGQSPAESDQTAAATPVEPVVHADKTLSRIAFGSCAKQDRPAPVFDAINTLKPEAFIWLGDNVYADTTDMTIMRAKYRQQAGRPSYQALTQSAVILGTWDDHDYGQNDAGAEFPAKKDAKIELLNFLGESADSARRGREGVYEAYEFGPAGRRVQVILLDMRWFRGPVVNDPAVRRQTGSGPYPPTNDPTVTMLGDAQWAWLEAMLRRPADVRIIGSSMQLLANQHTWERWGMLPHERQRMIDLIDRSGAGGVVVISGDRHAAEISSMTLPTAGYPLYDVTSSSLNSPLGNPRPEVNELRTHAERYTEANFGLIEIDWSAQQPSITMQVRGAQGNAVISETATLRTLQPKAAAPAGE